jgi:limonene-1,2-epoxide hydrolase
MTHQGDEPMTSAVEIVERMIAGWEALDADAVASCFSEDGVWHNMPYPPIKGRDNIRDAAARFVSGMTSAEFRIHHQGEISPGVVVNERNDIFQTKAGKALDFPVMGVFEIENGLIKIWRDYFDSAVMNQMQ